MNISPFGKSRVPAGAPQDSPFLPVIARAETGWMARCARLAEDEDLVDGLQGACVGLGQGTCHKTCADALDSATSAGRGGGISIVFEQHQIIAAPFAAARALLTDFVALGRLIKDMTPPRIDQSADSHAVVSWRQKIPYPLVPDVRYTMAYRFETRENRRTSAGSGANGRTFVLRYALVESRSFRFADGLAVLEDLGDAGTRHYAVDALALSLGPAERLLTGRIEREILRGFVDCDLALRARLENPTWATAEVRAFAAGAAARAKVDVCLRTRAPAFGDAPTDTPSLGHVDSNHGKHQETR